jgi:hypothetical protein
VTNGAWQRPSVVEKVGYGLGDTAANFIFQTMVMLQRRRRSLACLEEDGGLEGCALSRGPLLWTGARVIGGSRRDAIE